MEENIMDEQTTNNIIKQKEEEDISRWEIEQLEKLTTDMQNIIV